MTDTTPTARGDGGTVECQQTRYVTIMQDTTEPTAWVAAADPWPVRR